MEKIFILSFFINMFCLIGIAGSPAFAGEQIIYNINPVGKSEYTDEGEVSWEGQQLRLATFRTRMMGFDDTEKIYSDPKTLLPLRVERHLKWTFGKEDIVEEYDQRHFQVTIKKYQDKKLIEENKIVKDIPIHNAVVFPFQIRNIPDPKVGWSQKVAFPDEFEVKLMSIDDIRVPAGRFKAYHFVSTPNKFEIWISQDENRIPLQIHGGSGLKGYTMKLYKYVPSD